MMPDLVLGVEFFAWLAQLDEEMARLVALAGCPRCGGPLHQANYQRKPRGALLAQAGEAFTVRHSLCCGREGCRRRALPPSLRFLGRRVYVEAVVLLASMATQIASALREACAATGVPGRTLRRWCAWWRGAFAESPTWMELRARFAPPPPEQQDLPRSFVVRLGADLESTGSASTTAEACGLAARLLAPATTLSVPQSSRFVRGLDGGVVLA